MNDDDVDDDDVDDVDVDDVDVDEYTDRVIALLFSLMLPLIPKPLMLITSSDELA
jgi:hypothetical protein